MEKRSKLTAFSRLNAFAAKQRAALLTSLAACCTFALILSACGMLRAEESPACNGSSLDLHGYHLSFDDEFNTLSVSSQGPGTRWFTQTKGTFGDARFVDPGSGFPYTVSHGALSIEARKFPDGWRSGIIASVDPGGNGFSQQYGYFEMRAKFPKGPGTWPGFWMLSTGSLTNPKQTTFEIDIVEQYGRTPATLFTTIHWWPPKGMGSHRAVGSHCEAVDMSRGFHTYGLLWTKDALAWYFDRHQVWTQPTPPEARSPMYLLVDLALGSGWPITHTPNPSIMRVDYVRAYTRDVMQ